MAKITLRKGGDVTIELEGGEELSSSAQAVILKHKQEKIEKRPILIRKLNGLPSKEAIEDFIQKQANYSHNVQTISQHFLGRQLKSHTEDIQEKRKFAILSKRIKAVRYNIQKKENGKWEGQKEGFGKPKTYYFVR